MKELTLIIFSIAMSLSITPIKAEESNDIQEITYEMALESVKQQLAEQDALRFLPMYEESLKEEFNIGTNNQTRNARKQSVYLMSNGGAVYYSNYLGYKVEVTEIYLARNDASQYMAKSFTPSALSLLLGAIPYVGTYAALISFVMNTHLSNTFKRATANKGTLKIMKSADHEGSAKVISYWSDAPYIGVYPGGRVNRK